MSFFFNNQGEWYALFTAIFWTITALAFESASLKVGSLSVNIIRLVSGFLFLSLFTWISKGYFFPVHASGSSWMWLTVSGLIGFVFGDLFLFKSYTLIGSRNAMLIMALVPPLTAFFGWLVLSEKISLLNYSGMGLTIVGIGLAILGKQKNSRKLKLKLSPLGLLYAFGGALGQALGLIFSKKGMYGIDAFEATQIRIIAGIAGFAVVVSLAGRWKRVGEAVQDRAAMKGILTGSFFGPFLGVSFSLLAIAYTATAIASTIMAIVPILILPPAYFLYKQKVSFAEVAGAFISVSGVALFFIF
ncbi:MAG: DMT family transporter [Bacteroidales bacterium]|nr:DMT family transporter [Bacteroidales bacterium]